MASITQSHNNNIKNDSKVKEGCLSDGCDILCIERAIVQSRNSIEKVLKVQKSVACLIEEKDELYLLNHTYKQVSASTCEGVSDWL